MEEEQQQQHLPFLKKTVSESNDGRPPPCIGICYYQKLQALQAREELTKHNQVLKQDCVADECVDYRADVDKAFGTFPLKHSEEGADGEEKEEREIHMARDEKETEGEA